MWQVLTYCDNYYLYKVIEAASTDLLLNLTDFVSIWSIKISKEELVAMFQDENPLYSDDKDIFVVAFQLLLDLKAVIEIKATESRISVKWKNYIGELPLRLTMNLMKQINPDFRSEVAIPMIQSIQYLEWKQKKLEYLLEMKDKELMEYKFEYGNITRKIVETRKYEPDHSMKEDLLLNILSTNEEFVKVFGEKHGDIRNTYPEIKGDEVQKQPMQLAPSIKKRKY